MFGLGSTFNTYKEFEGGLEEYQNENAMYFYKRNSITLTQAIKRKFKRTFNCPEDMKYFKLHYACAKGGKNFQTKSNSIRKYKTLQCECPAKIKVLLNDKNQLYISEFTSDHNHELNKTSFKFMAKNRRLNNEEKQETMHLMRMKANSKDVQKYQLKKPKKHLKKMSYSLSLGKFVGKVAIVTGASAEIGKALTLSLVKKGITAAGLAKSVECVEEHFKQLTNHHGKLHGFKFDVTNQEEVVSTVKKITEKLGSINNNLVSNAGVGSFSSENFAGKVAIVTGASAEIGKALAVSLVQKGITAADLARRVERMEEHFKHLSDQSGSFKYDVTNREEIISTVKKIKTWINTQLRKNTWDTIVVSTVAILTKEIIAKMKIHSSKGHIIEGQCVEDLPQTNIDPDTDAITALTEIIRLEIERGNLPIKITAFCLGNMTELMTDVADAVAEELKTLPELGTQDIVKVTLFVL
ncbi:unnamed protein product [Ceutorhynchus assimilis]|uniref:ZSWIM3 N-terminal domain-containing protein n=1 Tax=Ceutorhynchus assimilis TaxID=467358 RepID=A0A9N9MTS8_9CUCU|nr:unnamed protein product [Ceutorhynchus assimilis]